MISTADRKILKDVQERLAKAITDDDLNRQLALEDLEFVGLEDSQWPEDVKAQRLAEGRPCLTINKMAAFVDQVVGDQRMNRPSIKVVPVDSDGDIEIARIIGGWIKHVEQISKSDVAIDHGFEHSVICGYGALRVVTKYVNDSSFDQDAYIEKVDNALAVYWGKHLEYDCSDANYCIIITDLDRDEFKEKYKKEPMDFNTSNSQYVEGWCSKDTVRVAEYFVKEPKKEKIYLLSDDRIVSKVTEGDEVVRTRTVESFKIMQYIVSGTDVLEKNEWVGKKYIPIVPIWGKEVNVGGRKRIRGLIRHAKDSQRMFNYWTSVDTEIAILQPKVPYLVTPKQISGHESQWNDAHKKNFPYLLVNPDSQASGWPKRESPPVASSAMSVRLQNTDQEMRDTVGLQKASLGMQSNERSGKAIIERKKEGDVGTFAFIDNLSRSVEHLGRILVDIAPGILDTERIVRLGLIDGKQEFVAVNKETMDNGVTKILNDTSVGQYDAVVTVGPSFTTQRSEARQSMSEFIQYYPNAAPLIGDLYAKSMDWPGAEEVSERLEFLLPPEVKEMKAINEAKINGEPPPSPPQQPPPSPEQMMEMESNKLKLKETELKIREEEVQLAQEEIKLEQERVKLAQLKQSTQMSTLDYIDRKSQEVNVNTATDIDKKENDNGKQ